MKEKSQVEDIDRSIYDFKDDERRTGSKLIDTRRLYCSYQKEKHDPAWMGLFLQPSSDLQCDGA